MKSIMDAEAMTATKYEAKEKWKEYVAAAKSNPQQPEYKDLRNVYNQIKHGKKVVDIAKVIRKGGLHPNHHPKFAIAKATTKKVWCHFYDTGRIEFINRNGWGESPDQTRKEDVIIPGCFPAFIKTEKIPKHSGGWQPDYFRLRAPVPIIPAKHRPVELKDNHYILWEVDTWEMVPPTDPYLLERITPTLYVVLAAWDLTPLEKSVMAGRMY